MQIHRNPTQVRAVEQGMALIAVLWLVAALTILVTGFSRVTRDEIALVSSSRQAVRAQAQGQAVIALALQELAARTPPISRVTQADIRYQGVVIPVSIMPLNGLIDINSAPVALLARAYELAGGLSADAAQILAQATVDARTQVGPSNRPDRFEAVEDLLRLPGMDYDLYARLRPLLTVYVRAGGHVNPMAAPPEVLTVLASGNAAVATRIARERDLGTDGIDTTALEASFVKVSSVRRFLVEALVPLSDGFQVRVAQTVDLGFSSRDGLPWRTLRSERSLEPMSRTVAQ